eukprot:gnl/MRDRNA2_/MRDRNA2_93199_c0_seq1.p1 gnl/MRDRNA2_/MRDRNA2_93199_c0~~gnl/MRDRNA2_/MRDRNA2_93199_c0_seq1.p1  ORF type:complete len:123 (+),score=29.96 gnl/MRDRNA2_/MRDRNA2_93199_c0_seq1:57-425(+)
MQVRLLLAAGVLALSISLTKACCQLERGPTHHDIITPPSEKLRIFRPAKPLNSLALKAIHKEEQSPQKAPEEKEDCVCFLDYFVDAFGFTIVMIAVVCVVAVATCQCVRGGDKEEGTEARGE